MSIQTEIRPDWRFVRDQLIINYRPNHENGITAAGGKHMDRYALVPEDQVPSAERAILGAEWLAYELMLKEPRKAYVQDTFIRDFRSYLEGLRDYRQEGIVYTDFGCGNGGMAKFFIDEAARQEIPLRACLLDQSPAALQQGMERFRQDGFQRVDVNGNNALMVMARQGPPSQTLEFLQRNVTNTGLEGNSVRAASVINVFHHLTAADCVLAANEIYRILEPGGLFIIEDTAKLPDNLFGKLVLPRIIAKAVSIPTMRKLAAAANIEFTDDLRKGAELFVHDAQRAFIQAFTLLQFEELLRESRLGDSLATVRELKSPKFPWKYLFPSMNYAVGYKR